MYETASFFEGGLHFLNFITCRWTLPFDFRDNFISGKVNIQDPTILCNYFIIYFFDHRCIYRRSPLLVPCKP